MIQTHCLLLAWNDLSKTCVCCALDRKNGHRGGSKDKPLYHFIPV